MKYRLIITPDNADPAVEEFADIEAAARRGAQIIRWDEPEWSALVIMGLLKQGKTLTYHDYSEIRIEEVL